MNNSTLKPGKPLAAGSKPMRRTPMRASLVPINRAGMATLLARQDAQPKQRKRMKASRPRMTKIRSSANGEHCTFRFPCCNGRTDTTVWCHSNNLVDGKGTGIKANDLAGAYGCAACHAFYDGGYAGSAFTRDMVEAVFGHAMMASHAILRAKRLVTVPALLVADKDGVRLLTGAKAQAAIEQAARQLELDMEPV